MAYLADMCGSISIAVNTNNLNTGVSTDINVAYFRKASTGLVDIISTVDKGGRSLAYTSISFYSIPKESSLTKDTLDKFNDNLIAKARHTKFLIGQKM